MAVDIHLVLQGGGAKFFCLVAALDALQKLVAAGKIRVKSVTGTSAGAIAGALYAAGVSMEEVRDWLKDDARGQLLRRLSPRMTIPKMVLGIPLIAPSVLDEALHELFSLPSSSLRLDQAVIGDFGVRKGLVVFHSMYTDLGNNSVVRHGDETRLLQALSESAGLPFVLRTYRSKEPNRVDGGICENLPTAFYPEGDRSPVVALAFRKDVPLESGLLNYAASLLFTAIDHSVTRAKSMLEDGNIHEIDTDITTLDFAKVLACSNDKEYGKLRENSKDFFERFIDERERIEALGGDPWRRCLRNRSEWAHSYAAYMRDLGEIYEKQWGSNKLPGRLARLVFHFESDGGLAKLRTMKYVRVISGAAGPLHVTKVELESAASSHIAVQKVGLYREDYEIKCHRTPIYDSSSEAEGDGVHLRRPILVWPLVANESLVGDTILEVETPGDGLMQPLAEGRIEELLIDTSPFLGSVETVEIYVVATQHLLDQLDFHTLDEAEKLGHYFEHPGAARPNWRPNLIGRVDRFGSQDEAIAHANRLEPTLGIRLGDKYSLVRWHVRNAPTSAIVGMLIRKRRAVDGYKSEISLAAGVAQ